MSYLQLSSLFFDTSRSVHSRLSTTAEDSYFMTYATFSSNFGWYPSAPYYQATHGTVVSWHFSNVPRRQDLMLGVDG